MRREDTSTARKREREQQMVAEMIAVYCKGVHWKDVRRSDSGSSSVGALCPDCAELVACARERSARCPRMDGKTFCSACPVHCYRPEMRERIRVVMRYAGPRMLLRHPLMTVWHGIETMRAKRAQGRSSWR